MFLSFFGKKNKKKSCHGLEPDTMKLIKKINTPLNPLNHRNFSKV